MLLEQCAALAFGHATPDAEFNAVVEGIGAAFQDDRTVTANYRGFALRGPPHEEFIWICLTATGLRHPCDTGLGLGAVDNRLG